MPKAEPFEKQELALRDYALAFPEATEEFPWEHRAIKVRGKIFVSFYREKEFLSVSLKLPDSHAAAVQLPFASPTRYGLGKSGWVTAKFKTPRDVPLEMLKEWIDESFRAIAPKRLVAKWLSEKGTGSRYLVGRG